MLGLSGTIRTVSRSLRNSRASDSAGARLRHHPLPYWSTDSSVSLADFAKLVELFDQHDVSFVSVTQQFNTTTSMGRLTLNVLLSFAQFEREVTSERSGTRSRLQTQGPLGRRHGAARLRHQGPEDHRQ